MVKMGDLAEAVRLDASKSKRHIRHKGERTKAPNDLSFMLATGLHWYALLARSGAEFDVEALLEARGLVAIVPVRREWRRVNRYVKRKAQVRFSLLPRYVFVGFGNGGTSDYDDEVRAIMAIMRELTLVQGVVGRDDAPARMVAREVALFLRDLGEVIAPGWQKHVKSGKEFDIGDEVQITDGPFEGHITRVDAVIGRQAKVTLALLFGGGAHNVMVPLANLEKSA